MTTKIAALTLLATGAFFLHGASDASAQYTGPGAKPAAQTVAEILKNPVDDQNVSLKGVLTKKVGSDKYTFSDSTGEIRVEIDAEDFPKISVDEKTTIQITGEVEKDFMTTPEIDVDTVSAVN